MRFGRRGQSVVVPEISDVAVVGGGGGGDGVVPLESIGRWGSGDAVGTYVCGGERRLRGNGQATRVGLVGHGVGHVCHCCAPVKAKVISQLMRQILQGDLQGHIVESTSTVSLVAVT